jgi:hypothetical protein
MLEVIRSMIKYVHIIALAPLLYCCGCSTHRTIDFSRNPDSQKTVVTGAVNEDYWHRTTFEIVGANGRSIGSGSFMNYIVPPRSDDIELILDAGENLFIVKTKARDGFFGGNYSGIGGITADLEAGRHYRISGKYDGLIRMWVENTATHEIVSEVVDVSVTRQYNSYNYYFPTTDFNFSGDKSSSIDFSGL